MGILRSVVFNPMHRVIGLLALLVIFTSGCYCNVPVGENQIGLKLDGGKVVQVVGPGLQSDPLNYYADLRTLNINSINARWEDKSLVSRDMQDLGFTVDLSFARKSDEKSIRNHWQLYNNEAKSDKQLTDTVLARVPQVVKDVTTRHVLAEMLGINEQTGEASDEQGRQLLQTEIKAGLQPQLDAMGVNLLYVGVSNIDPDQTYVDALKTKTQQQVRIDALVAEQAVLKAQNDKEKQETEVQKTIAARDNEVAAERNKVYATNPQALELEKLRLLKDVIGPASKIYFVPQGADLTLLLSGEGTPNVVPVPAKPEGGQ